MPMPRSGFFWTSASPRGSATAKSHAEYDDLKGNVIEVKRKPHLNWHPKKRHGRKVVIDPTFADAIRARGKDSGSKVIIPNTEGNPDEHLLRKLQRLVGRNNGTFHTELHKLHKTAATRWRRDGMEIETGSGDSWRLESVHVRAQREMFRPL